jgi:hypothetical protein
VIDPNHVPPTRLLIVAYQSAGHRYHFKISGNTTLASISNAVRSLVSNPEVPFTAMDGEICSRFIFESILKGF